MRSDSGRTLPSIFFSISELSTLQFAEKEHMAEVLKFMKEKQIMSAAVFKNHSYDFVFRRWSGNWDPKVTLEYHGSPLTSRQVSDRRSSIGEQGENFFFQIDSNWIAYRDNEGL